MVMMLHDVHILKSKVGTISKSSNISVPNSLFFTIIGMFIFPISLHITVDPSAK